MTNEPESVEAAALAAFAQSAGLNERDGKLVWLVASDQTRERWFGIARAALSATQPERTAGDGVVDTAVGDMLAFFGVGADDDEAVAFMREVFSRVALSTPAPTRPDQQDDGLVEDIAAAIKGNVKTVMSRYGMKLDDHSVEIAAQAILAALKRPSGEELLREAIDSVELEASKLSCDEVFKWEGPMELEKIAVSVGKASGMFAAVKMMRDRLAKQGGGA